MKRFVETMHIDPAASEQRRVTNHSFTLRLTAAVLVLLMFLHGLAPVALAESPVKIQKGGGVIDFSPGGVPTFTLEAVASHLGEFTAHGEVEFVPGEQPGTLVGRGVAVFEAANGDLLVGVVIWERDNNLGTGHAHFSWRDSVQFSDGTVVSNTGRFVDDRPPGVAMAEYAVFLFLYAVIYVVG